MTASGHGLHEGPGSAPNGVVRFGPFELHVRAGELLKYGRRIRLQEHPFQVLAALLACPGEVVTREELQRAIWPADTFVDFQVGLDAAVYKLRQVLGDSAENPRFVETLPRRGYRFIAPVACTPDGGNHRSAFADSAAITEPDTNTGSANGATSGVAESNHDSSDPCAYERYLRGLMNSPSSDPALFEQSIQKLTEAVEGHPNFALAHAALSYVYALKYFEIESLRLWLDKAEFHCQRSLALDPNLAEARLARAFILWSISRTVGGGRPRRAGSLSKALQRPRELALGLATGIAICILLVGTHFAAIRDRFLRHPATERIRSLVVLPLEDLSGVPSQEYFADGMTEALTTDLGKIATLRIISRTSASHYKHTGKTLPEVATELQVDGVVEGSVTRSGGRVRITAQLIRASTDQELWAETYERDAGDVMKLEDQVARDIANAISIKLSEDEQRRLENARVVDPDAEEAYLKGRYVQDYSQEGLTESLAYFEEAVQNDPQYAPAWASLSNDYLLLGLFGFASREITLPRAKAAAVKAVEFDDTLSDAHVALAAANLPMDRSWEEAEREAQRAIALNPSNAIAHEYYGYFLSAMGRFDQAIAEMRRARELDPLSPMVQSALGITLYRAGHYDEALEQLSQVPDPDADSEYRHRCLAAIYERKRMQPEAMAEILSSLRLSGRGELAATVEQIYSSSGYAAAKQAFLHGHLEDVLRRAKRSQGWSLSIVVANDYALLGRKREALKWLDRAIQARDGKLLYVNVDDPFRAFRSDPDFQAELHKIGLPVSSASAAHSR